MTSWFSSSARLVFEEREPDRRPDGVAALVAAGGIGALLSLGHGLGREDAVAERKLALHRHVHQRPGRLAGHDLEMVGAAAHHTAKRHRAVVRLAGRSGGVERDRHAGRDLKRARNADEVIGRAGGFKRPGRAFHEMDADRVIEARFDDQKASALDAGRGQACGSARLGHAGKSLRFVSETPAVHKGRGPPRQGVQSQRKRQRP